MRLYIISELYNISKRPLPFSIKIVAPAELLSRTLLLSVGAPLLQRFWDQVSPPLSSSFLLLILLYASMSAYQKFLDDKVKAGLAPGLSAVVFDKDKQIFVGTSGVVSQKQRGIQCRLRCS